MCLCSWLHQHQTSSECTAVTRGLSREHGAWRTAWRRRDGSSFWSPAYRLGDKVLEAEAVSGEMLLHLSLTHVHLIATSSETGCWATQNYHLSVLSLVLMKRCTLLSQRS